MGQFTNGSAVLSYLGVQATTPPQLINAGRAPKSTDTAFILGTFWLYSDPSAPNNFLYQLIKMVAAPGAAPLASWVQIYPAMGGPGTDFFLADNAVSATFNNASTLTLSGDGTNTNTYATAFGVAFQLNPSIHLAGSVTADTGLIAAGGDVICEAGDIIATDGDVVVTAGNILMHDTNAAGDEGVIEFGGAPFIHNIGTENTFVGSDAGNFAITGDSNTGVGFNALEELTTGDGNVAFGDAAGTHITTGSNNTLISTAGIALLTGSNNILIGYYAGENYVAAESSNIILGNAGTAAESHVIRIGTQGAGNGQQNTTFIAGIYNVTPAGGTQTVTINASGQLGSSAAGGAFPWTVTTVDANMVSNNGYIANKAGLLTMTLPAVSAVGDIIRITGMHAGGSWLIAQLSAPDQQIFFNTASSTLGNLGSISSNSYRDTVELVCIAADTEWQVISSVSSIAGITVT